MKLKVVQQVFEKTSTIYQNTLISPAFLRFVGPSELVAPYGNGVIPPTVKLYAYPLDPNIDGYAHTPTDELYEINITNRNENVTRESFRDRDREKELLANMDVDVKVIHNKDITDVPEAHTQTSGRHPIAYPVANKIRGIVKAMALDNLGDKENE